MIMIMYGNEINWKSWVKIDIQHDVDDDDGDAVDGGDDGDAVDGGDDGDDDKDVTNATPGTPSHVDHVVSVQQTELLLTRT